MKRTLFALFFLFLFSLSHAKDSDGDTFLILFDKSELKQLRTSPAYIELSLLNLFKTKSYSGNSDAAIIVKVPKGNIDECQLGDMFIRINNKTIVPLQEVALKIINLDESKNTYQHLLMAFDDKNLKNKKNKPLKTAPAP